MSYALIKDNKILYFSDEIPEKAFIGEYQEETNEETGEVDKICIKAPVEGVDYDMAIDIKGEYDYTYNYIIKDGKITMELKPEFMPKIRTKEEVRQEIGTLVIQKNGMIELGEDTTEIDNQIEALKQEYNNIS